MEVCIYNFAVAADQDVPSNLDMVLGIDRASRHVRILSDFDLAAVSGHDDHPLIEAEQITYKRTIDYYPLF